MFGMLSPVPGSSQSEQQKGKAFHSFTETISELLDLRGSLLFHRNTAADTKMMKEIKVAYLSVTYNT